jgi:Tol biopolymer transport system component
LTVPAALVALSAPAEAVVPGQNGRIAFHRATTSDIRPHIWSMNADGTGEVQLTTGPPGSPWDQEPAWNPQVASIAFHRTPIGCEEFCPEIWTMNTDGTNQQRLTSNDGGTRASGQPSWAPDGSRIAFWANGPNGVWVMNANGSDQHLLTADPCGYSPDWSPRGDKIAFVSCRHANTEIYVMNADGTGQTRLTNNTHEDESPAWSPDGRRIAFTSDRGVAVRWDVYVMDADGTNETRLTTDPGTDSNPAWSPDQSKIAFQTNRDDGPASFIFEIYVMNADGTNQTRLTNNSVSDAAPDWQAIFRGYARPKAATPFYASLVPAYTACSAPDRLHGPPLAFGSCASPSQTSAHLTVGTPDANGAAAQSIGWFRWRVQPGVPGQPHDTLSRLDVSITDVRCTASATSCGSANAQGGADYTGELDGVVTMRHTDRWNALSPGGGPDAATMVDYTFHFALSCAATADTAIGSSCTLNSYPDAYIPGFTPEGKRAIWELEQARFYDGGADGLASSAGDNTLFAVQGLFVP